jgi:hypothetical protein
MGEAPTAVDAPSLPAREGFVFRWLLREELILGLFSER